MTNAGCLTVSDAVWEIRLLQKNRHIGDCYANLTVEALIAFKRSDRGAKWDQQAKVNSKVISDARDKKQKALKRLERMKSR